MERVSASAAENAGLASEPRGKKIENVFPERQGQNLAWTVLNVPSWLDAAPSKCRCMLTAAAHAKDFICKHL